MNPLLPTSRAPVFIGAVREAIYRNLPSLRAKRRNLPVSAKKREFASSLTLLAMTLNFLRIFVQINFPIGLTSKFGAEQKLVQVNELIVELCSDLNFYDSPDRAETLI